MTVFARGSSWPFVALVAFAICSCRHAPPTPTMGPNAGGPVEPSAAPPPLEGHNLLYNEGFTQGARALPWNGQFGNGAEGRTSITNGELCMEVKNKGKDRWDAQLRQQHIRLQKGHSYAVQFKMHASAPTRVYLKLGQAGPPYKEFYKLFFTPGPKPQVYSGRFTMLAADDAGVELAFHLGGQLAKAPLPFTVCLDDAHLDDPQYTPVPEPSPPPILNVLVNQVGYLPALAKIAIVKNPAAVPWTLLNAKGESVASGVTIPFGDDHDSGEKVSAADFTGTTQVGTGYTIKVGNDVSHPFDIRPDLYKKLKYDALAYYYQTRSGIEIKMPYAGDPKWAHPAGHVGVKPNHGDGDVPCAPGSGCDYKLDVRGGWYDAGDHGKYIISAGISVWTLLNWWERTKVFGTSAGDFADGKMNIPENANGVPDLLDEARWELEFELKMQVPEGQPLAGMVHAKIHDGNWTQLGLAPQEDPMVRYLQPPTTAASLNLAANAAQAARVWKKIDLAFSQKCLAAAERAWAAAVAHPEVYQSKGGVGGGPYDDDHVDDEFYWAAAELYVTTGKDVYKESLTKSPHFKEIKAQGTGEEGMYTPVTWANTQFMGSVSLAVVPNGIGKAAVEAIRKNLVAAADEYLEIARKQGYRVPFAVPPQKGYPWGSSSFVLNNALLLGLAHDFTHDGRYLNGVGAAMDYILGRNPLDQSYVTGWGSRPLENPYHRFWCHQSIPAYPPPPPGVLSGGPNSGFEDPYMQGAGLDGCAPQKCFIDNGEAWSANEVTINWNAPLAWVAAYLDEAGAATARHAPATTRAPAAPAAPAK
ncbi:MAG TPA: glycoside hydrolase family 9 protein [Polyangia bacterium]|jgi:endoglucanase|nr:glycoside hydrolase family 9 protein [Polyangia bacterium]